MKRGYSQNRLASLSRWLNGMISGDPDSMICSDLHELSANLAVFREDHPIRYRLYQLIERIDPGHCARCWYDETRDSFRDHADDDWLAWLAVPLNLLAVMLLFGGGWSTGLGLVIIFASHYFGSRLNPFTICLAYLLAALLLAGCATGPENRAPEIPPPAAADVREAARTGAEASQAIDDGVEAVRQVSASGRKEAPKLPQWTELDREATTIGSANGTIAKQFALIDDLSENLRLSERAAADSAETIAELEEELKKAKSARSRWIWGLGIALGGVIMAGGIGLLFVPGMRGLARIALAVGGIIMGVSKFFLQFPWVLPLIGAVFVAFGGYVLWRNRRTILELVDFGQVAKHVPWGDGMKATADNIESPATRKAVADAKKRHKSSGETT